MVGNTKEVDEGHEEEMPAQGNRRGRNFFSQEWRQQVKQAPEGKVWLQYWTKKPLLLLEEQKLMLHLDRDDAHLVLQNEVDF